MAASKNPLARLEHIRDEIAELTAALEGLDFETFTETYILRRTAEHAILIVSEAVKALSPEFTDRYEGIDWRAVRDVGNVLRHDYFSVDPEVIWRIAKGRLPELRIIIDRMIADLDDR